MLKTVSTANGLVSPTFSGNVTLSTGNLIIGTSGKGIDFSATPGTGTSELLADYEEGTFTPTGANLTVVGTPTFTGTYTKIGRIVYININLKSTTSIASTQGLSTLNLPFTSNSGVPQSVFIFSTNLWQSGSAVLASGAGVLYLGTWNPSAEINISGCYIT